jgi:hypothetical protein
VKDCIPKLVSAAVTIKLAGDIAGDVKFISIVEVYSVLVAV